MRLATLATTAFFCAGSSTWKPLSKLDPGDLFSTVERGEDATPGALFRGKSGPLPTNAWWENAAIAEDSSSPEGNIFQMPYVLLADGDGLHAMQPFKTGATSQGFDKVEALTVSSVEAAGAPRAVDWDQLTLTLSWAGGDGAESGMKVPVVRGSPYVTAEYTGATPKLSTEQSLRPDGEGQFRLQVDGEAVSCGAGLLSGRVLSFELVQSDATWAVFSPPGVEWTCTPEPFGLQASGPLSGGAVRAAIANSCSTGTRTHHCEGLPEGGDTSAYLALLAEHAGSYPVGVSLDLAVAENEGVVTWEWDTRKMEESGDDATPLQLAYPVHLPLLSADLLDSVGAEARGTPFRDIRGPARPIAGKTWVLTYTLFPDVGLSAPRPIAGGLREEMLKALRGPDSALWNGSMPDKDFDLPLNYKLGVGDTYFAGKMLARLARLIVIADELGESKEPYFSDMVVRLTKRMEAWFREDAEAPFIYDVTWGGLLSCGCTYDDCGGKCDPKCSNEKKPATNCPALTMAGMNFGNAYYNDHHFHYGYYVYSAAVAAKYAPDWEQKYREQILAIVRDYANPSSEDRSFPVARHKDWFLGTSWAGGIPQAYENGRNQESTSESIHSYYAIYAYGASVDAPFASGLKDFGRLLTAMESHGADTYWHVRKNVGIYGEDFPDQVIGILWDHVVEHQTWFGGAPYIVSGIQLLPFVPAMENYLDKEWVEQDFAVYKQECDQDPECAKGWSWPMCLEQAVLDPAAARDCMRSLPGDAFDTNNAAANGNSLTNSLHWIATRPEARGVFGDDSPDPVPLVASEGAKDAERPSSTEEAPREKTTTTLATTSTLAATSTARTPSTTAASSVKQHGASGKEKEPVQSGDEVFLRAHTGTYLDVQGTKVRARWDMRAGWQRLTIEKEGGGPIGTDDTVYLRANTQAYLDVAGSVVGARWANARDSQEFVIQGKGQDAEIRSGDTVFFTAHTGNCLEVKGTDVSAKSPEHGAPQAFVIEFSAHAAPTTSDQPWILQDGADAPRSGGTTMDPFMRWAQIGVLHKAEQNLRAGGGGGDAAPGSDGAPTDQQAGKLQESIDGVLAGLKEGALKMGALKRFESGGPVDGGQSWSPGLPRVSGAVAAAVVASGALALLAAARRRAAGRRPRGPGCPGPYEPCEAGGC